METEIKDDHIKISKSKLKTLVLYFALLMLAAMWTITSLWFLSNEKELKRAISKEQRLYWYQATTNGQMLLKPQD